MKYGDIVLVSDTEEFYGGLLGKVVAKSLDIGSHRHRCSYRVKFQGTEDDGWVSEDKLILLKERKDT